MEEESHHHLKSWNVREDTVRPHLGVLHGPEGGKPCIDVVVVVDDDDDDDIEVGID